MADGCANFMGTWCVVSYTLDPNVAEWILDTAASSFQDDEKFDNVCFFRRGKSGIWMPYLAA